MSQEHVLSNLKLTAKMAIDLNLSLQRARQELETQFKLQEERMKSLQRENKSLREKVETLEAEYSGKLA